MEQQSLINLEPEVYYLTDHYMGYEAVLVRLPMGQRDALRDLLGQAWRFVAPKRLVASPRREGGQQ